MMVRVSGLDIKKEHPAQGLELPSNNDMSPPPSSFKPHSQIGKGKLWKTTVTH